MNSAAPRPICFVVMPFGKKAVVPRPSRAPRRVDFDALWAKAFKPALEKLGYEPVRADQDLDALIIHEMIERLYFSDLVMADLSIPNANVYYEIGVRHASRKNGCVLIAAEWAVPLFDTAQMRRLAYPMPEGEITDATAKVIRSSLKNVKKLAEGETPIYTVLPGYPDERAIAKSRASSIKAQLDAFSVFQARAQSATLERDKNKKKAIVDGLIAEHPPSRAISTGVAVRMVTLIRDTVGWAEMIEYLDKLPKSIRELDFMTEQRALAISKLDDHLAAVAALEQMNRLRGPTSERWGIIGGRYKKLYEKTKIRDYLNQAIAAYEQGMKVNLNDYYPTGNLPRLYLQRKGAGDKEKAVFADQVTRLALSRAKELDPDDPWIRPTELALAFDCADVDRAEKLLAEVRLQGHAAWQLDSLLTDLRKSPDWAPANKRKRLRAMIAELEQLSASRS